MKSLVKTIERLLWEEWDPIEVRQMDDWPSDEYDSYAHRVLSMLSAGGTIEQVETYLVSVETEVMGLNPSGLAARVARRAVEVYEESR